MTVYTAEVISSSNQAFAPQARFWAVDHQKVGELRTALDALNARLWDDGSVDTRAAGALAAASAELLASMK